MTQFIKNTQTNGTSWDLMVDFGRLQLPLGAAGKAGVTVAVLWLVMNSDD